MTKSQIKVDPNFIALTLMLPKIGKKTALKIFNSLTYNLSNNEDLFDFLCESRETLKIPDVSIVDFDKAKDNLMRVISQNEKQSIKAVSYFDTLYPNRFRKYEDAPILMYYKGNSELFNYEYNVGIIGTRQPYEKALTLGRNLSRRFAEKGFNIVSGLAKGCDSAAHLGALDAKGRTTAFLGHGLQMVYPKESVILAQQILENDGLLISEYPVGTNPLPNFFIERDRLQAYLSDLLIVIQTDVKGGTMHAVNKIVDAKKTLAVMFPDRADFRMHDKTRGNEFLIKSKGAVPLVNKEDIDQIINRFIPLDKQNKPEDDKESVNNQAVEPRNPNDYSQEETEVSVMSDAGAKEKYSLNSDDIDVRNEKIDSTNREEEIQKESEHTLPLAANRNIHLQFKELKEQISQLKEALQLVLDKQDLLLQEIKSLKKVREKKQKTKTDDNNQSLFK